MARESKSQSKHSDWFFFGQDFAIHIVPHRSSVHLFVFESRQIRIQVPYMILLTSLACRTDLAVLGPHCHNLGPIFSSKAFVLF